MQPHDAAYHSNEYQTAQKLALQVRELREFAFTQQSSRNEFPSRVSYQLFSAWASATQDLVDHIQSSFVYPQALANIIESAEAQEKTYKEQQDNEARLGLFAAKYLVSHVTLCAALGKETRIAYEAQGVYQELMHLYPTLIRFGFLPLKEALNLLPSPQSE